MVNGCLSQQIRLSQGEKSTNRRSQQRMNLFMNPSPGYNPPIYIHIYHISLGLLGHGGWEKNIFSQMVFF